MDTGIAKAIREKYPACYIGYSAACNRRMLEPGRLLLWKGKDKWVLHFPTQIDWWQPSRIPYIEHGLQKFVKTYKEKGILSAAFPLLGCESKGLSSSEVIGLLKQYLGPLDIRCEIYTGKST